MKRSKVIEAIAIELEDINIKNYYDEKGSEWCANLVLMRMEELGMLPPPDDYINISWHPEKEVDE